MRKAAFVLVASTLLASSAEAQIARVFAAVSGNDLNDCIELVTACRTLTRAIDAVNAGGEVIVTETGSYAGASINKSVKINVPSGVVAFSGLPIIVTAAASDVVVVRGLTLKAFNVGTGIGIRVDSAGAVFVENCVIDNWSTGVYVNSATQVFIKDSTFRNNASYGVDFNWAGSAGSIDNSRFEGQSLSATTAGLAVHAGKVAVTRSFAAANAFGFLVVNAGSELALDQTEASNNTTAGFESESGARLTLLNSVAAANPYGVRNLSSAAIVETFGNNVFRGNTTETFGTLTLLTKQ